MLLKIYNKKEKGRKKKERKKKSKKAKARKERLGKSSLRVKVKIINVGRKEIPKKE